MWPRLTMRCSKRTSSSLTKVAERIVAIGIVTTNQTEMRSCIGMNNNSHIYIQYMQKCLIVPGWSLIVIDCDSAVEAIVNADAMIWG